MRIRGVFDENIMKAVGTRTVDDHIRNLMSSGKVEVVLDVGCEVASRLTMLHPQVKTFGLVAYTVDARFKITVENILKEQLQHFERPDVNFVSMF